MTPLPSTHRLPEGRGPGGYPRHLNRRVMTEVHSVDSWPPIARAEPRASPLSGCVYQGVHPPYLVGHGKMSSMPTILRATSAEARAYEALMAHARRCRICKANGRDLCKDYLKLFLKWDALNRNQS